MEEIIRLVGEELSQIGYTGGFPGGLVMTGGTANVAGVCELAEQVLGIPAVKSAPRGLHGLVDVVRNPRYSTACGLVMCGAQYKHLQWFSTRQIRIRRRGSKGILRFWKRSQKNL